MYKSTTPSEIFDNPKKDKTRWFINRMHVYDLEITSKNFDFPGFTTELSVYAQRQMIFPKTLSHVMLVFEELCVLNIIPKLSDEFSLKLSIAYDTKKEIAELTITYNGKGFNPINEIDEMSSKIINGMTDKLDYSYDNELNKQLLL